MDERDNLGARSGQGRRGTTPQHLHLCPRIAATQRVVRHSPAAALAAVKDPTSVAFLLMMVHGVLAWGGQAHAAREEAR